MSAGPKAALPTYEEYPNEETKATEEVSETMEDKVRRLIITSGCSKDVARYRQLYIALLHYDWEEAEDFIRKNPETLTAIISEFSESFFHNIAESDQDGAIRLLQKYLPNILPESLEQKDSFGSTALFNAAIVGNIKAAKLFVARNRNLLKIRNNQELLPLHYAGISGHKETVKYLLSETKKSNKDLNLFVGESGFRLVKILIEANLYDIASDLLEDDPNLACEELSWRGIILETLAKKPKGFESGSRLGYWQRLIYHCIPVQEERIHDIPHQKQENDFSIPKCVNVDMENPVPIQRSQNSSTKFSQFRFLHKLAATFGAWNQKLRTVLWNSLMHLAASIQAIHDKKLMHKHTFKIVRMMCARDSWSFEEAIESLKMPILTAARLGIPEIVKEIIKAYPDSIIFVDNKGHNALMLAILHRQENVFKLVSQFGVMKQLKGNNLKNKTRENILHLAAKSVPASEIPGAALQMQRELQWFKAVENYVQSPIQEEQNCNPREMFTKEHENLVEKGEKWMRDNASSCTIAVSLIITVVFAAAFTVPGGNDDKGIPNFLHELAFIIFVTSDCLALFSSTSSLLMFLGILTSSYSEEDFLVSLPKKLIIGLITMLFSIARMMVAFGATIYMVLSHPWKWVIIPIALLGCIPVTLFAMMQFPFLV